MKWISVDLYPAIELYDEKLKQKLYINKNKINNSGFFV